MRTRTKLRIGAGLLLLAAGAVRVRSLTPKPAVVIRFVGYDSYGGAVLSCTNRSRLPMHLFGSAFVLVPKTEPTNSWRRLGHGWPFVLDPHTDTQILAYTRGSHYSNASSLPLPSSLPFRCVPVPSLLQAVLADWGIIALSTGSVATVGLPPR